jgi:predicted AAA+ superfamily ATPase
VVNSLFAGKQADIFITGSNSTLLSSELSSLLSGRYVQFITRPLSFIHALLGYDDRRIPGVMENVIYNEPRRREYEVFVGQYDDREIDFVAVRGGEKIYVQAVYRINDDANIIDREFGNLLRIGDQFPKYVVSLDERWTSSVEGVRHVYLPDFLLMERY